MAALVSTALTAAPFATSARHAQLAYACVTAVSKLNSHAVDDAAEEFKRQLNLLDSFLSDAKSADENGEGSK